MNVLIPLNELQAILNEYKAGLVKEIKEAVSGTQGPKKNLNAKQAADFLGISIHTLYKSLDKIPHKKFGKKLLFNPDELVAIKH